MKISLDRKAITLAEVEKARELQKEYEDSLNCEYLTGLAEKVSDHYGNLIKIVSVEVTKNHYQLTIWADVILQCGKEIVRTNFDVLKAEVMDNGPYDSFTKIYRLVES